MKTAPLLLFAGIVLAACEPLLPLDRDADRDFGEIDTMQAAPRGAIIDTTLIAGTDWLLARVGWSGERDSGVLDSSSGYKGVVANIVILDKQTGASVSLLPNERNILRGHRIIWPEAGVVDGLPPSGEDTALPPTHFMLDAELRGAGPRGRRLLIGTLDDFTSSLVARGYTMIHHAEMLDATRLSLLVGYPDRDELLVIDLPGQNIELRRVVDPARVAR